MIQMFLWKFLRNSPFVLKPQSLLLQLSPPIKRKLKENAAASNSIFASKEIVRTDALKFV